MLADHRDGLSSSSLSLILDSSVGLSAGIQSAEDWVSETLWVRILHSAEEDNLSPFDSKIACLCQSIEINNGKYIYRQSQVRMPNGSGVRWAECLLIIGTGCRVQVLAWSSIAQSVCQQASSVLKIGFLRPSGFESCIQQRKTTCLLSIRKSLACARASKLTTTNMYIVHIQSDLDIFQFDFMFVKPHDVPPLLCFNVQIEMRFWVAPFYNAYPLETRAVLLKISFQFAR